MSVSVSIIVPIYGVETYITRCAESVLSQTYSDVEYIFVNDCTPDHSIERLQEVIARYPKRNVRIIHHDTNQGLGAARRTGVMAATGDYILNVDSDDYLEPNTVEVLVAEAQSADADMVAFDGYFEWTDSRKAYHRQWDSHPESYVRLLLSGRALPGVCFHLIRHDLYTRNELYPIPGINTGEDYVLTPRLAAKATRIAYVPLPLYHYIQTNTQSYTAHLSDRSIMNLVRISEILTEWTNTNPVYREALQEGLWMKKTEMMMNASRVQYNIIEQMVVEYPCRTAAMNLPQRIASIGVRYHWHTFICCYSALYRLAMMLVQKMKGR